MWHLLFELAVLEASIQELPGEDEPLMQLSGGRGAEFTLHAACGLLPPIYPSCWSTGGVAIEGVAIEGAACRTEV